MFIWQKRFQISVEGTLRCLIAAFGLLVCAAHAADSGLSAVQEQNSKAAMQLAAKIAASFETGHADSAQELVTDYESVYGNLDRIPARWPALVRRALVCQQVHNQSCVRSSIESIERKGGIDALPLNRLFEVSRFRMSVANIRLHLQESARATPNEGAAPVSSSQASSAPSPAAKPADVQSDAKSAPARVDLKSAPVEQDAKMSAPPVVTKPAAEANPTANAPESESGENSAPVAQQSAAIPPTAKTATPRSLTQKVLTRLNRIGNEQQSGYFLDALFVILVVCLALSYFLFSATRSRNIERETKLRAIHEFQTLESLRAEEKLQTDHALWSEQLKAEVALEAQKAHAEEMLRLAQLAADEALQAERTRFAEELKAEKIRAEQALMVEKRRADEAIKIEQLKAAEAIKSAKLRADQAIDAYDQMAARELVHAHKQNDELQEALNQEKERREAQELKTEELMQAAETFKLTEARYQEIIRAEQRARVSEARQAAEKLKAAQQAAAALQSSLVTTRAQKADLERRADEAMRAAELRIAEARQNHSTGMTQEIPSSMQPPFAENELAPSEPRFFNPDIA